MAKVLWLTVTDGGFFPGTLAAINSILRFHPDAEILAVEGPSPRYPALTETQRKILGQRVRLARWSDFTKPGRNRVLEAWQLKTYALADNLENYDCVVGFDSDAMLYGPIDDIITASLQDGKIRGGKDTEQVYDASYAVYGFPVPIKNQKYFSSALYTVPNTPQILDIIQMADQCNDKAKYGPQSEKVYPGHGDQGILNACAWAKTRGEVVQLLDNNLWTQHWHYDKDVILIRDGRLWNHTVGDWQRAVHCGGSDKWWTENYLKKLYNTGQNSASIFGWFLWNLFFGSIDVKDHRTAEWLTQRWLIQEIPNWYWMLNAFDKAIPSQWLELPPHFLDSMATVPRSLSIETSMRTYIHLAKEVVASQKAEKKIVEIGVLHGGSAVTLAIALLPYQVQIWAIDHLCGNGDGTVDGHPLPVPQKTRQNLQKFVTAPVCFVQLPSTEAAKFFPDKSLDLVFIDGNHSTEFVRADIWAWKSKIRSGGYLAGDDFGFDSVATAVKEELANFNVEGAIWYVTIP